MIPPFGDNLLLIKAMAPKGIGPGDLYRSIIPFVLVMGVRLALVVVFLQIVLWLSRLYFGK